MKTIFVLGDCTDKVIMENFDLEEVYKKAVFLITECLQKWDYDTEEIMNCIFDFRTECRELQTNKRTFASCLDICEIYKRS